MSQSDRRAVTAGAIVILPLVAAARGLPAMRRWQAAYVDGARERISSYDRGAAAVRALPRLRGILLEQSRRLTTEGSALLESADPSATAAVLGSLVDSLAVRAGIRVTSLELNADTTGHGPLMPLSVRLIGSCDVAGLMRLARLIDESRVAMAIRDLDVTVADPTGPDTRAEVLHIDIVVASLARRDTELRDEP